MYSQRTNITRILYIMRIYTIRRVVINSVNMLIRYNKESIYYIYHLVRMYRKNNAENRASRCAAVNF